MLEMFNFDFYKKQTKSYLYLKLPSKLKTEHFLITYCVYLQKTLIIVKPIHS